MFITFTGGDCVGKTTQANLLAGKIDASIEMVKFPTLNTKSGILLNKMLSKEVQFNLAPSVISMLFADDRKVYLNSLTDYPNVEVLIADRYVDCGLVYPKTITKDEIEFFIWYELTYNTLPKPDVTIFLYSNDIESIVERAKGKNGHDVDKDVKMQTEVTRRYHLLYDVYERQLTNSLYRICVDGKSKEQLSNLIFQIYKENNHAKN